MNMMADLPIEPGDVVRLRSGGERVTVAERNGQTAIVCWFRSGILMSERVNVAALQVVGDE